MSITSTSFRKPIAGFVEAASGTGMAVTGNSNMVPSVAAGNYWVGGIRVVYAGGTVTLNAAHATLARIDLICADNAGTITAVTGTPAASPTAPFAPENRIILARIAVAAGTTSITNANITDLRDFGGLSVDGTTISISASGVLSANPAAISPFVSVVASGNGSTAITGSGAAQNVFTDTFTALANGDQCMVVVNMKWVKSLGAGTPDAVLTLGATTVATFATISDTNLFIRTHASSHSTANRGFVLTERVDSAGTATGTAAMSVITNTTSLSAAINSITLTLNPAAGTNGTAHYTYTVLKFFTGV